MTSECPLSNKQREKELTDYLTRAIGPALEEYFENSPFMVDMKKHYRDHQMAQAMADNLDEWKANHEFVSEIRSDIKIVKKSLFRRLGNILAFLFVAGLAGRLTWPFFKQMFAQ